MRMSTDSGAKRFIGFAVRPAAIALLKILGLIVSALAISPTVLAVPSFARQTGFSCNVCHTTPPELTAYGRSFKLSGYTFSATKQIQATDNQNEDSLSIGEIPPLSAMTQFSFTNVKRGEADKQNNNVEFPQQLSFFFAGKISPHLGSFMQITYDHQSDHFSLDMTDVRYANQRQVAGHNVVYGATLNNGPGTEDPWNTGMRWGFPWVAPDIGLAPESLLLDGRLDNEVAGIGAYTLWDNTWYANLAFYRSSPQAGAQPIAKAGAISGAAPYWRFAWQHDWSGSALMLGTYGMLAKLDGGLAGAGSADSIDKYLDYGVDAQYEKNLGKNLLSVHANYLQERRTLSASETAGLAANSDGTLDRFKVDGTIHWGRRYASTLGLFTVTGTADDLLYAPAAITGSANGKPNSSGWTGQLTYLPWQNTQFALQYTGYTKFNGARTNYDGAGRNAGDNNTLYLLAWFVW